MHDNQFSDRNEIDAPVVSIIMAIAVALATPIAFYTFYEWPESLERQIVALGAILSIISLALFRKKFEILIISLLFFSQFTVSLHSFNLTPPVKFQIMFSDVIILALLLVSIERRIRLRLDSVGLLFLLMIFWFGITTYTSLHMSRSFIFLMGQIKYLILYILALNARISEGFSKQMCRALLLAVFIQGAISIAQIMSGGPLGLGILGEFSKVKADEYFVRGNFRCTGTISGTNGLAGYMSMLLVFLFPFVLARQSLLLYLGCCLGLISLIFTLSRAGWLSFVVGAVCVVFMLLRSKLINMSKLVLFGVIGGIVLCLTVFFYFDKIANRFQDRGAVSSAVGRIDQFATAWPVIKKYPLFGIGPGVTEFFGRWNDSRKYIKESLSDVDMPNQVHNSQLQVAIESGFPGVIIFSMLILALFSGLFKKTETCAKEELVPLLRIGSACAAVAVIVHTSFGTEFNTQSIFLVFWPLLGFARGKLNTLPILASTTLVGENSLSIMRCR